MITEPEIVESPAQTIAFIHVTVPRGEIMAAMNAGLEELSAVLKAQAIAPTGPWFSYHFRRPNETFDFRICFPVDAEIKPTGRVEAGQFAAATVARTIYSGNYTGLAAAWGQFLNWIEEHRYNTREDLWERYLVNPDTGAQPEEWRTELNRPLA
jgi:effector-binding domain-containing protein